MLSGRGKKEYAKEAQAVAATGEDGLPHPRAMVKAECCRSRLGAWTHEGRPSGSPLQWPEWR